jgi:hypothetical protein
LQAVEDQKKAKAIALFISQSERLSHYFLVSKRLINLNFRLLFQGFHNRIKAQ